VERKLAEVQLSISEVSQILGLAVMKHLGISEAKDVKVEVTLMGIELRKATVDAVVVELFEEFNG